MPRPTKRQGSRHLFARKVVPQDVRGIIGRSEFKAPLRGKTPAEIKQENASLVTGWEAEIAAARLQLRGEMEHLTQKRIQGLCGGWYHAQMAEWEEDPGDAEGWQEAFLTVSDSGPPGPVLLADAAAYLRRQSIATDSESVQNFAVAWREARVRLYDTLRRRAEGDYSTDRHALRFPTAEGSRVPQAQGEPLMAEALLEAWALERTPAPNTLRKYKIAFAHVARILGFDDVRRITEDDVVRFKEARLGEKRTVQTVADDVLACGAVCAWGVKNRRLKTNPFQGLAPRPKEHGEPSRSPYTDDEAASILNAARGEEKWRRWLPWLLAFTGARISEIAEMRRGDVKEEEGVPYLDLVPVAGRAGKNKTFQRKLPVHPEVLAEGFLAYVEELPADPAGPLFPDLKVSPDGTRSTTAKNNHGRWVRNVAKVTRKGTAPAHSWRHRMEDELRRIRALPEVVDAITGRHNPRNAGAGYGIGFRGMPDETLKELRKVPLPKGVKAAARQDGTAAACGGPGGRP